MFTVKYRVLGTVCSQVYENPVFFNDIKPSSGTIAVNNSDSFANRCTVQVKVGGSDAFPGLWKMRYNEAPFGFQAGYREIVGNGTFESMAGWDTLRASIQDGYVRLWGREAADTTVLTAWAKKTIAGAVADTFRGKLLRITNDVYSQNVSKAKRFVEVRYGDTLNPLGALFGFKDISTGAGGYWRSQSDTFTLNIGSRPVANMTIHYQVYGGISTPPPGPGQFDYTLSLDNIRLEPVGKDPETQQIVDYWAQADTQQAMNYQITTGDGTKRVYLQLMDSASNISSEPGWFDEITLDQTKPSAEITTPLNGATINVTVGIYGYSNDAYYDSWRLEYKPTGQQDWLVLTQGSSPILPVPPQKPSRIYLWNTTAVSDGDYYIRLYALDWATNQKADTHLVHVDNGDMDGGRIMSNLVTFNGLPVTAAADEQGNLQVSDAEDNKMRRYTSLGDSLGCFVYRSTGPDTTGTSLPVGMAMDDSGDVWVADCYNDRINKYSPAGDLLLSFGERGIDPGMLKQPTGIVLHDNVLYIADRRNNRVQKFDLTGNFIGQFGDSVLFCPTALAFGRDLIDTTWCDFLYVSDTKHNRIAKFTLDGVLADTLAYDIGLDNPWGICFDDAGNLYVADVGNDRIVALDPYGLPFLCFGGHGNGPGKFKKPQGLAVSPDGCCLYVVDTHNKRLQRFELRSLPYGGGSMSSGRVQQPLDLPTVYSLGASFPNPLRTYATFKLALPKTGMVKMNVYNITGQLVKALVNGEMEAGYHSIRWDGKDNRGMKTANGVYLVKMSTDGYNALRKLVILR